MDTKIKDIILRNISKSFNGVNIINNLSIEIPAGSKVAVTGKSGAGKSTLVNMLMGFILPDNGKITLMGMDVNEQNINEIRENISWVPQELNIDVRYVRDLLLLPFGYNKNKKDNPSVKTIINALDMFGLKEDILSKDVSEISGGEKQRIFLTSSYLLKRKICFLDEPTSGLDSDSKRKVINYFLHECASTVVAVTHDEKWMDNSNIKIDLNNNDVKRI
ncbi:MAG: ABC transporter ATP-binding protein [Bacteroidetes bacterium]|nr:ABC transporter ATP-binding protein [Bacteroidota bacterium]